MASELTPAQFIAKWSRVELSERAASQEHFIDLCRMLGQPTPAEHDATGAEYTFEKGVTPSGPASRGSAGEFGFADVWWRGKFGWEYKRKGKYRDLAEAYRQLCQYREALDNPPLLIVCDITRTEIHTNFTGTAKQVHTIELENLAEPESLDLLRRVFTDPQSFKPTVTTETVTEEVAKRFGKLAQGLRDRGHDPHEAAHFLMKCMFCLFAEDVGLLPNKLFERLLGSRKNDPAKLTAAVTELFFEMKTGGSFGVDEVPYFNGNLFDNAPALDLTVDEIAVLLTAAKQDWGSVEPAIFGTLFERSLDPDTRAQIGAHYTSRDDILLVVEPVILDLLRREWTDVQSKVDEQLARRRKVKTRKAAANKAIADALQGFIHRLSTIRILDPACGSGNFLYVAIQQLLHLEKEVRTLAARPEIALPLVPLVRPTQLHGIEINPYAAELAQVVIWIGYLQWMRDNGFNAPRDPILEPLQTIERRDAILDLSDPNNPKAANWPDADFIIGNPPFLGRSRKRRALGEDYVEALNTSFDGEVRSGADLCCYWFKIAIDRIAADPSTRVGLLATQGIRRGTNQQVLRKIKQEGDIFFGVSDRKWTLDGATVHVAIVGFDSGIENVRVLDGNRVAQINADLTSGVDLSNVPALGENNGLAFQGIIPMGPFDPPIDTAMRMLRAAGNPNARPNSDVICRWANGEDVLDSRDSSFIVDFFGRDENTAAMYESPFEFLRTKVLPAREEGRTAQAVDSYWLHWRPRPVLRRALRARCPERYIVTPRVSKHRIFVWADSKTLPSDATVAFARSDDYMFGILQSSVHCVWSVRRGTQLREQESAKRYSHTFTFATYPMPWSPSEEPIEDGEYRRVAEEARTLAAQREQWLNPPEWIDPIAKAVDAEDDFADVPEDARELIRQSAIMARAAKDKQLKRRTLTNLYNERPTWLKLAHEQLDRAVLAAYASTDPEGDWSEDWAQVWVETGAGQPLPDDHNLAELRTETDQLVLANLLRMNLARAER